jgi:hypothetical protein
VAVDVLAFLSPNKVFFVAAYSPITRRKEISKVIH